jgi:4-hydroxy-3-polyprenylbenzoate decarboxylase
VRLIVGISGASGAIYGIRMLQLLSQNKDVETHLIISKAAKITIEQETEYTLKTVESLASYTYDTSNIGARIASGSFLTDGMVIIPCSMKSLSAISNSYADNLLVRAADTTLKERRRLILVSRETPLHLGHLRNMERLVEMGAIIFPPVPSFYNKPQTIQEIIDQTVGRVLDLLNIENTVPKRWQGI